MSKTEKRRIIETLTNNNEKPAIPYVKKPGVFLLFAIDLNKPKEGFDLPNLLPKRPKKY